MRKHPTKDLAKAAGVSRRHARRMGAIAKLDPEAAQRRLTAQADNEELKRELNRIDLAKAKLEVIPLDQLRNDIESASAILSSNLQQFLVEELPPHIAGKDVIACREMLQDVSQKILKGFDGSLKEKLPI